MWCHAGSGGSSSPPSNFAGPGGGSLDFFGCQKEIERKAMIFRLFETYFFIKEGLVYICTHIFIHIYVYTFIRFLMRMFHVL